MMDFLILSPFHFHRTYFLTMQQFIFIRHGESLSNAGSSIILPNADIPLTHKALQQAQDLASTWETVPSAIYTSEFIRTQQTANPLCDKYAITATPLAILNECDTLGFDLLKTLPPEEKLPLIQRYWKDGNPHERIGQMGETYAEFCGRVAEFTTELPSLKKRSIIIGHGMWLAQFLWQSLKFGNHQPTQESMQQFGNFFLHLPIANLAQFNIVVTNNHIAICKRFS